MAKTGLAKTEQARAALAATDDPEEIKSIVDTTSALAKAAKRVKADRRKTNDLMAVAWEGQAKLGEVLGPHPGKGVGGGRGKLSTSVDSLSPDDVHRARMVRSRIQDGTLSAYLDWLNSHTDLYAGFQDALTWAKLAKQDGKNRDGTPVYDFATPKAVIEVLHTGVAENLPKAVRIVKRRNIVEGEHDVPEGVWRTLIVDPPWPMSKISREAERPHQEAIDYATMSVDEIKGYHVPEISHDEAHCYLWTTQKFLPASFDILDAWGFKYLVTMVWHKAGGFQPTDLPQYNCEFVLVGRKGGLGFLDTTDFMCCFGGDRREHSRKPVEFYDLVRRVSPAPRKDVFSRETVEGFDGGGFEGGKFDRVPDA